MDLYAKIGIKGNESKPSHNCRGTFGLMKFRYIEELEKLELHIKDVQREK